MNKANFFKPGLLLILVLLCPTAGAQEGYPLEGTWQGMWGTTTDSRNFLSLVLHWDGTEISGQVNPGRFPGIFRSVSMDSSTWTVTFDIDVVDRQSGERTRVRGQGQLLKLSKPDRIILGELTGSGPGSHFKIERQ